MTASTPDELIAGFPQSSLPKVTGEPTFEYLKVIRRLLNTNDMSVASYEGGGRHGHLGIIMTNEEYFAIAVDVFPVPANPGPSAAVVAGMTAAVIAETTRLHREATQVYLTYHNVDQAIKKLIIESFDDAYLNALSDEIVGYANCKSLQLLTHLLTYYAMIAPHLLNSRRTTSDSTRRMILINRSRCFFSKFKTPELSRLPEVSLTVLP
jgi:6-pyruvoyl-tetrahydropterin synthase